MPEKHDYFFSYTLEKLCMAFHDSLDLKLWERTLIFFLHWVHVSALLQLMVSGNFMKMTMYLIFHVFINLNKTIPNIALPGHFVQWRQILLKAGKGMFSCNTMLPLLLSEGASAFGSLAVVMLHATALNCGRLISNSVWFCAMCPESEHSPQCEIKSDVRVYKGLVKW